jgi:hypothetical protein
VAETVLERGFAEASCHEGEQTGLVIGVAVMELPPALTQ